LKNLFDILMALKCGFKKLAGVYLIAEIIS
jgi:hypothetical protein